MKDITQELNTVDVAVGAWIGNRKDREILESAWQQVINRVNDGEQAIKELNDRKETQKKKDKSK